MRRDPRGDQPNLGQGQPFAQFFGQAQVTEVDGIEGPAEDSGGT